MDNRVSVYEFTPSEDPLKWLEDYCHTKGIDAPFLREEPLDQKSSQNEREQRIRRKLELQKPVVMDLARWLIEDPFSLEGKQYTLTGPWLTFVALLRKLGSEYLKLYDGQKDLIWDRFVGSLVKNDCPDAELIFTGSIEYLTQLARTLSGSRFFSLRKGGKKAEKMDCLLLFGL